MGLHVLVLLVLMNWGMQCLPKLLSIQFVVLHAMCFYISTIWIWPFTWAGRLELFQRCAAVDNPYKWVWLGPCLVVLFSCPKTQEILWHQLLSCQYWGLCHHCSGYLCASFCSELTGCAKGEDAFISKIPIIPSYILPHFRLSGPSSLQTQVTVLITVKNTKCKSTNAGLFA